MKARNSDFIPESGRPEPHYKFFLLRTDHYRFIIYLTIIYTNKKFSFDNEKLLRAEIKIKLGLVFDLYIFQSRLPVEREK